MDERALSQMIDHTLLAPEATSSDVDSCINEAVELQAHAVCLSPSQLPIQIPSGSGLKVVAVCGFPSGKHLSAVKAKEAAYAVECHASEIDMVIDLGAARAGNFVSIESDVAAVREAVGAQVGLKVIIESAVLDPKEIVNACLAVEGGGADFVKTSTGFHPRGGATLEAVRLMAKTVAGRLGVKASGGIRTRENAEAMVAAGATRLGVSNTRALLRGSKSISGY